jgi:KUP system potassium uptake protein
MQTTYFLGGESLTITDLPGMQSWRKKVFRFLSTNANTASDYFSLPANRVVQIGLHVEI